MHAHEQAKALRPRFHRPRARRLALSTTALLLAAACSADRSAVEPESSFFATTGPRQGTFYGPAVRIGDGTGRSYVAVVDGLAVEVGLALSERALENLPDGPGHDDGSHNHYNEYLLRMHPQNPTPVEHIAINWNSDGHEPEEIYGVPHFDFHFYQIPREEVVAIHPSNPQWRDKANRLPPPELVPEHYLSTHAMIPGAEPADATVPRMGLHWVDGRSPELHGAPFTETFIYGSWDGAFIFLEPMITRAFLLGKPQFQRELPKAQRGYNPGSYRIYWNEARREYRVALTDLPTR